MCGLTILTIEVEFYIIMKVATLIDSVVITDELTCTWRVLFTKCVQIRTHEARM